MVYQHEACSWTAAVEVGDIDDESPAPVQVPATKPGKIDDDEAPSGKVKAVTGNALFGT